MASVFWRRQLDLAGKLNGMKDSMSSWDKCMEKSYCKWPVIVAIVVGVLILVSVLWCVFRCLCCGAECACCCFRCCGGCCGGGRRKHEPLGSAPPTRHQPAPFTTQQYASPAAPSYAHAAPSPGRPQFATFDVSKGGKVNEDSLPAMPSWEAAQSRKVEVYEEPEQHEMNDLDKNGQNAAALGKPMPGFAAPGSGGRSSPGLTPQGSYVGSDMGAGGAYGGAGMASDSHSGYRGAAPSPNPYGSTSDVGTAISGGGAGYARRSPAHSPVGDNHYGSMNAYGNAPRQSPTRRSPTYNDAQYPPGGPGPVRRSPTYNEPQYPMDSPGPARRSPTYNGSQYPMDGPRSAQRSPTELYGGNPVRQGQSPVYQQASSTYNELPANNYQAYQPQGGGGGGYGYDSAGRKPVNGSWRDV